MLIIEKIIDDVIYESKHLFNYLNSKNEYIVELENNPFRFYNDVHVFKKAKNECLGLIYDDFFVNFSNNINLLRKFIIAIDKAKNHTKNIY